MPAIYTHYKFGKEVLSGINKKSSKNIKKHIVTYYIFNQSFDTLYYHYLFVGFIGKNIRDLGTIAHKQQVNNYFKNITQYIISNKENNNYLLKAYLYGSINHYILDSTMHPYVFYKTGVYNSKNPKTYKYNGLHSKFEFMLDSFFYRNDTNLNYNKLKVHKELIPKYTFNKDLKDTLDYTFKKTFNVTNMGKTFNTSYKHERFLYKLVIEDSIGIKKRLLKFVDLMTTNKVKNIANNSTYIKNIDYSILNVDKKEWNHPSIKNEKYNHSVIDLYSIALEKSIDIINKFELMFEDKYNKEELFKELGDNSYITGLPSKRNVKMRFFEF